MNLLKVILSTFFLFIFLLSGAQVLNAGECPSCGSNGTGLNGDNCNC